MKFSEFNIANRAKPDQGSCVCGTGWHPQTDQGQFLQKGRECRLGRVACLFKRLSRNHNKTFACCNKVATKLNRSNYCGAFHFHSRGSIEHSRSSIWTVENWCMIRTPNCQSSQRSLPRWEMPLSSSLAILHAWSQDLSNALIRVNEQEILQTVQTTSPDQSSKFCNRKSYKRWTTLLLSNDFRLDKDCSQKITISRPRNDPFARHFNIAKEHLQTSELQKFPTRKFWNGARGLISWTRKPSSTFGSCVFTTSSIPFHEKEILGISDSATCSQKIPLKSE